jgi:hypothetical protein
VIIARGKAAVSCFAKDLSAIFPFIALDNFLSGKVNKEKSKQKRKEILNRKRLLRDIWKIFIARPTNRIGNCSLKLQKIKVNIKSSFVTL